MGEKTGFLTVLIIFSIFIIPFLFNMLDAQVKTNKLLTLSNEVQQLMVAEGDITPKVTNVVDELQEKGVKVEFRDTDNNIITGRSHGSEKIIIHYEFDGYETSNAVILNKR